MLFYCYVLNEKTTKLSLGRKIIVKHLKFIGLSHFLQYAVLHTHFQVNRDVSQFTEKHSKWPDTDISLDY